MKRRNGFGRTAHFDLYMYVKLLSVIRKALTSSVSPTQVMDVGSHVKCGAFLFVGPRCVEMLVRLLAWPLRGDGGMA